MVPIWNKLKLYREDMGLSIYFSIFKVVMLCQEGKFSILFRGCLQIPSKGMLSIPYTVQAMPTLSNPHFKFS